MTPTAIIRPMVQASEVMNPYLSGDRKGLKDQLQTPFPQSPIKLTAANRQLFQKIADHKEFGGLLPYEVLPFLPKGEGPTSGAGLNWNKARQYARQVLTQENMSAQLTKEQKQLYAAKKEKLKAIHQNLNKETMSDAARLVGHGLTSLALSKGTGNLGFAKTFSAAQPTLGASIYDALECWQDCQESRAAVKLAEMDFAVRSKKAQIEALAKQLPLSHNDQQKLREGIAKAQLQQTQYTTSMRSQLDHKNKKSQKVAGIITNTLKGFKTCIDLALMAGKLQFKQG